MGRPHTIIGAKQFHFRVRDGIGWYPLAIAARQTGYVQQLIINWRTEIEDESRQVYISLTTYPKYLGVIWSSLTGN